MFIRRKKRALLEWMQPGSTSRLSGFVRSSYRTSGSGVSGFRGSSLIAPMANLQALAIWRVWSP